MDCVITRYFIVKEQDDFKKRITNKKYIQNFRVANTYILAMDNNIGNVV